MLPPRSPFPKKLYRPRRVTIGSPPPLSAVRRLATERELGSPYQLVVLFRAPPPIKIVAHRMWIDAPTRKVTVVGVTGGVARAMEMEAIRRTHGWVAYADRFVGVTGSRAMLWTTGPLDPRDRDIVWAWGWKSKSAKALVAAEALR